MSDDTAARSAGWKWTVCGLLLLATMLNYMDRQTLAQTITTISKELHLNRAQYGQLEMGFGLAFALGGIITGFLVDRLSVRWLFPLVLIGWSLAGVATAYSLDIGEALFSLGWTGDLKSVGNPHYWREHYRSECAFLGLMACRVVLGFFEAGMWPCALITTQRILSRQERSLGNSILQSGASIGAIFTPIIVQLMVTEEAGSWRGPFLVIGFIGVVWVLPWLGLIRARDLAQPTALAGHPATSLAPALETSSAREFWRRYGVLVVIVVTINITWQFFRAWLPRFLEERHAYGKLEVNYFTSAYYIATDVGCLAVGAAVRLLTHRGLEVHKARLATFSLCAGLTFLSVFIPFLERGPVLLGVFLLIGAGALGLYPNFYALTQELSYKHQGKVTGSLSAITWIATSFWQSLIGRHIDNTDSYALPMVVAGLLPLTAVVAVWLFWKPAGGTRVQEGESER